MNGTSIFSLVAALVLAALPSHADDTYDTIRYVGRGVSFDIPPSDEISEPGGSPVPLLIASYTRNRMLRVLFVHENSDFPKGVLFGSLVENYLNMPHLAEHSRLDVSDLRVGASCARFRFSGQTIMPEYTGPLATHVCEVKASDIELVIEFHSADAGDALKTIETILSTLEPEQTRKLTTYTAHGLSFSALPGTRVETSRIAGIPVITARISGANTRFLLFDPDLDFSGSEYIEQVEPDLKNDRGFTDLDFIEIPTASATTKCARYRFSKTSFFEGYDGPAALWLCRLQEGDRDIVVEHLCLEIDAVPPQLTSILTGLESSAGDSARTDTPDPGSWNRFDEEGIFFEYPAETGEPPKISRTSQGVVLNFNGGDFHMRVACLNRIRGEQIALAMRKQLAIERVVEAEVLSPVPTKDGSALCRRINNRPTARSKELSQTWICPLDTAMPRLDQNIGCVLAFDDSNSGESAATFKKIVRTLRIRKAARP